MQERRNETRMLCADMVDVSWKEGPRRRRATGLLEDISASGACFQIESPVPVGAELHWRCPDREFRGSVRYCVYREIGYFVGVVFTRGCRWSRRLYKPEHLLDPARLAAALRD
jgi:hypothetical protein